MKNRIGCGIAVLLMMQGCALTRTSHEEASSDYLTPQGWQDHNRFLEYASFNDYAASVRREVELYRIPFDAENADQEVTMASPAEILPRENCNGRVNGIAILVHGLSDTAFAMRDIAEVLASACYISRTVLLSGHGTRAGDMLNARYEYWRDTLEYLIKQANLETETVCLPGFHWERYLLWSRRCFIQRTSMA